ncbi:TonB-dependent receptor domain-containing protein [Sphingomonas sp. S6]|jgi:iron complex outermembrane receptor protein|uniref:TonB-dependent receptor domain-containing protein n=1 Tax=Sphingomonas sp. S6 TaxID=3368600 RepID=UPI0028E2DB94|nr:TonB-dependent receptor [uncultured Sphingomonas sp.]
MMMYKGILASTCCLAALLAMPAQAQVTTDQDAATQIGDPVASAKLAADRARDDSVTADKSQDIIVTGTRIARPNNRSAAPITTVTVAEIAAQGATTIEEVMNRLPQVQANAEQNYADSDGRQRIKLRSLGFERTLTLVDGLRLGIQNGMDVSLIPNELVERIDVLSGGASSVYGSDAVAGVVNFVLKKDFNGIALTGNYSFFNHDNRANPVTEAAGRAFFPAKQGWTNDGGRANLTLTAGKTFLDGAVSLSGYLNYRQSDQVNLGDRSLSACEVTQTIATGVLNCTRSTYTQAGTIVPGGIGVGSTLVNDPSGSGRFVPYNSGPGTSTNPFDELAFQRPFNRLNTGAFLNARISSDIELYSTAMFYRDRSFNTLPNRVYSYSAYGAPAYQTNCDNPFLSASQRTTLCGTRTTGLVPLDVRYRFDALPLVETGFENRGVRVAGGLRGKVLDDAWRYDIAGVYSMMRAKTIYPSQPDYDRVNRSLNVVNVNGTPTCASVVSGADRACVPFNAFIPGNSNLALNDYLFTSTDGSQNSTSLMWQALAVLNGDLGKYGITSPLAEQGVAVAFASEFRAELYKSSADAQFRASNGGTDARFTQNVVESNVEVQAPLIEHKPYTDLLQVNGGYRVSKYNRLNGTFNTWKVEGIWAPIADIGFRTSFNKAQRAPTVIEADQASNVNYTTTGPNDPCASTRDPNSSNPNVRVAPTASIEQCRRTGLPDNLYGSATLDCSALNTGCTVRNGGFNLKPETAYTKTFGVILRPRFIRGLTVSADRFIINLNDSINFFQVNDFLNGCLTTGLQYYCRGIVRNPGTYTLNSAPGGNPATGYYARGTSNSYKSQSHGWDFQGQYTLGLAGAGSLDTSFNGTLTTRVGSQDTPDATPRNCVGYYGPGCGESMPRWSHGLRTTWTSADKVASVSLNWRHISGMTISYNAPADTGIPANTAQFRRFYTGVPAYDYIDLSTGFDIAKRFSLRVSVNNLFDRDPPLLPDSRNVLGLLRSNTLFRYDLLGRQIVVGASARF